MSFRLPDLTPEQLAELKQAEQQLAAIDREIARAERAGIDVTEARATAARYRELIKSLRRELGPRRGSVA